VYSVCFIFSTKRIERRSTMVVYVANAPGGDYDSTEPSGYDSWIDYWNKLRYPNRDKQAGQCRNCQKKTDDLIGGHVECCEKGMDGQWHYAKAKGIFIVPLCKECNHPDNTKPFSVDLADMVKVPDDTVNNFLLKQKMKAMRSAWKSR